MQDITTLSPDQLRPNDYNPNQMTDDEFAEVVAEVKHLGRLPKPVIVRPNGEGYVIVDGEHGWRAATECGLESIPCEVIEADDFEAMRQTFKRNQHGTHDPVRLGQMFRQMMIERDLSKRALAKEITVSEGTIRNSVVYAEMDERYSDLRNCYALKKCPMTEMTVRQVRYLGMLPEPIGEFWLKKGASIKELFYAWDGAQPTDHDIAHAESGGLAEYMYDFYKPRLSHIEFAPVNSSFSGAIKQIDKWQSWERWSVALAGLTSEMLRPYVCHYYKGIHYVRESYYMESALSLIVDTSTKPPTFLLTPDEFQAEIDAIGKEYANLHDFTQRLILAVRKKTGKTPDNKVSITDELQRLEVEDGAPDFIRESTLADSAKHELWKADAADDFKRAVLKMVEDAEKEYLPPGFDHMVKDSNKTEAVAKEIKERPVEEYAAEIVDSIVDRMFKMGLAVREDDTDDDAETAAPKRKKILVDHLLAELHQAEILVHS